MKGKKLLKQFMVSLLTIVLLVSSAVPVFAASYKKTQSQIVDTGQSYHVMNNNISGNKIGKYVINVLPLESGTRYDLVIAYSGREEVIKNCTKELRGFTDPKKSYIKSSSKSNAGMALCIKVTKGSVRLQVVSTTTNKNAAMTFKKQAASHQALKAVTVKQNRKVLFQQPGSNITSVPLVIASKSGSVTRRDLNGANTFENYTFNKSSLSYRLYLNGILQGSYSKNKSYDTLLSGTGYIMISLPNRLSGWFTTKKGSVTFYYPTDYLKISKIVK